MFAVAHKLCIDGLISLLAHAISDMIFGRAPEELRKIFNVEAEFSFDAQTLQRPVPAHERYY